MAPPVADGWQPWLAVLPSQERGDQSAPIVGSGRHSPGDIARDTGGEHYSNVHYSLIQPDATSELTGAPIGTSGTRAHDRTTGAQVVADLSGDHVPETRQHIEARLQRGRRMEPEKET
jgi:hypothetical protein